MKSAQKIIRELISANAPTKESYLDFSPHWGDLPEFGNYPLTAEGMREYIDDCEQTEEIFEDFVLDFSVPSLEEIAKIIRDREEEDAPTPPGENADDAEWQKFGERVKNWIDDDKWRVCKFFGAEDDEFLCKKFDRECAERAKITADIDKQLPRDDFFRGWAELVCDHVNGAESLEDLNPITDDYSREIFSVDELDNMFIGTEYGAEIPFELNPDEVEESIRNCYSDVFGELREKAFAEKIDELIKLI